MLSQVIARIRSRWIAPGEVRAEVWALGSRHKGEVVEGATRELRAPGLPMHRAVLLRAVLRSERDRLAVR